MRKLQGTISSDVMSKTVVVIVRRRKRHQRYMKYYYVSKKFKAHDEENKYHKGDIVIIQETRPLSKDKRWEVASLVRKSDAAMVGDEAIEDQSAVKTEA